MSCGVGHRHGLDLALQWLWPRPVATAPIRSLGISIYRGCSPKKIKKKKRRKKKRVVGQKVDFGDLAMTCKEEETALPKATF